MDAVQLEIDSSNSQSASILNDLIDVSIYRMIERGHSDSYLETEMINLAHSAKPMDSIIRCGKNRICFIIPVERFVNNTVHDPSSGRHRSDRFLR